jgi:hypothetical protein
MRRIAFIAAAAALPFTALLAQVTGPGPAAYPGTVTLYEYPGYLGRSVTISGATPDLATLGFANRARSARVLGEWQVCPLAIYQGSCQRLSGDSALISRSMIASLRPYADAQAAVGGTSSSGSGSSSSSSSSSGSSSSSSGSSGSGIVDLDALDADSGTEGQDVAFFARPSMGGTQVSAGSNDRSSGDAFCVRAGFSSSAYTSRARVQASGLIDLTARTRVRGFALRDVLCRR